MQYTERQLTDRFFVMQVFIAKGVAFASEIVWDYLVGSAVPAPKSME